VIEIPGYSVIGQIGRGGMATVYRARQTLLDREVALKVMSPQLAQDPVYAQRFLQEARMLAALNHPHVVPVYDVGVTPEGLHYFSMQLLGGGDFAARMREGISELELLRVLVAVAHALGFAHARGYVHRDVTPANILFDAHDTPILTDFGIARAVTASSRITASGLSIGTSHYMSPEQARGAEVDHRSDIYSLGVLCYEAVVGTPPFEGEDGFAVAFAHVHDPVPRLPEEVARWQPLIDRAMAKDPEQRFPDCAAFIDGLRELAPEEFQALGPIATTSARRVLTPPPAPLRTRLRLPVPKLPPWPILAVGAAAGVLLGLALWLGLAGEPAPATDAGAARGVSDPAGRAVDAAAAGSPGIAFTPAPGSDPGSDGQPVAAADGDDEPGAPPANTPADPGEPHTVIDPVATLNAMGRANIAALRLTSPPVTNALERFRLALSIEPGNREAAEGIAAVAQAYLDLADRRDPQAETAAWLEQLALVERVAAEHPAATAKAIEARSRRAAFATTEVERGTQALARWDQAAARDAFERALQAAPDDKTARRGLADAGKLGSIGYRFRDPLAAGGSSPELVVVGERLALGRSELTVGEFRLWWQAAGKARFAAALPGCRDREAGVFGRTRGRSWEAPGFAQQDDHPVVCLSYPMAEAYLRWLSEQTGRRYRLPSAAELTPLAAAPTAACAANLRDASYRREFNARDGASCDDGHAATAPVGSYPASEAGLRDSHGNVREWSSDCDGSTCRERITVGLGWHSLPGAALRDAFAAEASFNTVGLRIARELD
jgi:serine/threonine-protein kinase PpkA